MTIYLLPPQELDNETLEKQIEAIAQTACNVHHKIIWDGVIFDSYLNTIREVDDKIEPAHAITKSMKVPLPPDKKSIDNDYTKWAATCRANYLKLVDMGLACCEEWEYRFDPTKQGTMEESLEIIRTQLPLKDVFPYIKQLSIIKWARDNASDLPLIPDNCHIESRRELKKKNIIPGATPFPLVMPDEYLAPGVGHELCNQEREIIESYHNYYRAKLQEYIKNSEKVAEEEVNTPYGKGKLIKYKIPKWTRRGRPTWVQI